MNETSGIYENHKKDENLTNCYYFKYINSWILKMMKDECKLKKLFDNLKNGRKNMTVQKIVHSLVNHKPASTLFNDTYL